MIGCFPLYTAPGARAAALVALLAVACPSPAQAQGVETALNNLSLLSGTDFLMYAVMALAAFFGLIFVALIVRKFSLGRRSDPMAGLTYLDVTGMKKNGMLTEEEAARVREAMKKQVALQQAAAARRAVKGELGLISDPEVQRLEAMAEAKVRVSPSIPAGAQQGATNPAAPAHAGSQTRPVFSPRAQPKPQPPARSANEPILPGLEEIPELGMMGSGRTGTATAAGGDVPLPPDVVKMVDLGLITPDELERIKERIRAKRQAL